jgi:uncharacterized protein
MRAGLFLCLLFSLGAYGQSVSKYTISRQIIPMRDGVKLFTVIITPESVTEKLPILIQRTPYGADVPDDFSPLNCLT